MCYAYKMASSYFPSDIPTKEYSFGNPVVGPGAFRTRNQSTEDALSIVHFALHDLQHIVI